MLITISKFFCLEVELVEMKKKMSDIDIGLLGNEKFPVQLKFAIEEAIEESIVPFKVDLIDFYNVDEIFKAEALKKIVEWK